MENETFILDTENGQIECNVLLRFQMEENKKNYLVYTDNTVDEEGELNIFIASYEQNDDSGELKDIEDQQELEKITKILEEYWEE